MITQIVAALSEIVVIPLLQPPAAPVAPPATGPGLTTAPTPPDTIGRVLGMSTAEVLGGAVVGILLGLALAWLLRWLYRRFFDMQCWTETCTLIEQTVETTEEIENPTGGPPLIAQETCEYTCDSPFGIALGWLAEHIPGKPCPKKLVYRKCRYNGVTLVIWIEIDGVRKGLRPPPPR